MKLRKEEQKVFNWLYLFLETFEEFSLEERETIEKFLVRSEIDLKNVRRN